MIFYIRTFLLIVFATMGFDALALLPPPGLAPEHRDLVGHWEFTGGFCDSWTVEQIEEQQKFWQEQSYYEQLSVDLWFAKAQQLTVDNPLARPVESCYRSVLYRAQSQGSYVVFQQDEVLEDPNCPVKNNLTLTQQLMALFEVYKSGGARHLNLFLYGIPECGGGVFVGKYRSK
ncbi:MAG: hypothetical protein H6626_15085 [Pseudobdellovibrionaceae bacterium]|nr:hypothetical protein [Bdellovibrionales bacterium]USN47477.1 MAG: hypothetical protein H6626_15085 [Pseudobdellovibrionaceae bacterium]